MCGIFGYANTEPIPISSVLNVLAKLEVEKDVEGRPIGGDGSGIAAVDEDGVLHLEKVGKTVKSPVNHLRKILEEKWFRNGFIESTKILGHVRRASPRFSQTTSHRGCAQPYAACCHGYVVVSIHNGFWDRYEEKRKTLRNHRFESELPDVGVLDSEVLTHYAEELLAEEPSLEEVLDRLFKDLSGAGNTAAMLIMDGKNDWIVVHKGKTQGFSFWENTRGFMFCSRVNPVLGVLSHASVSGFRCVTQIAGGESGEFKRVIRNAGG
ncbi:MAG: hypothetical protein DRO11_05240 [Methanobacteriota archaeon]|nr:MAG: hypothetical protein DRO11_05240 [Euryarchaeota archaeon]